MKWGGGEAVMRSHSFKEQQQGCLLSLCSSLPRGRKSRSLPAGPRAAGQTSSPRRQLTLRQRPQEASP